MSKWSDADRARIDRALIVGEFGDASTLDYLAATSRADDGRNPSESA